MEHDRMIQVTVDGVRRAYPLGTPYRTVAADFQGSSPYDILLVSRDGRLCELHKGLDRDCSLRMVTALDKPGMSAARCSSCSKPSTTWWAGTMWSDCRWSTP